MQKSSFAMSGLQSGDIVSDAQGVRLKRPMDDAIPKQLLDLPWKAKWIWLDSKRHPDLQRTSFSSRKPRPEDAYAVASFKQTFTIDNPQGSAFLRVSADRKYRLFLNGRLIARGPAEAGGDYSLNATGVQLLKK